MQDRRKKLPIFGVGPIYVISCLILTILALILKNSGLLITGNVIKLGKIMKLIGIVLILVGIILWIKSVIFQKISEEIKSGHLVTCGIYSIVRNPIYSAFTFIFTGILLIASNLYLLIIPFIFWLYLTILLKFTEEKWLKEKFGEEYILYCKRVNRVIPWFRKKR